MIKPINTITQPPKICGLGRYANEVEKAGYVNKDGTVNLLCAYEVQEKYGKLVPLNELPEKERKEIEKILAEKSKIQIYK